MFWIDFRLLNLNVISQPAINISGFWSLRSFIHLFTWRIF